jgi:hypothetical protein
MSIFAANTLATRRSAEAGYGQVIGTGIPTAGNVHQVAGQIAP